MPCAGERRLDPAALPAPERPAQRRSLRALDAGAHHADRPRAAARPRRPGAARDRTATCERLTLGTAAWAGSSPSHGASVCPGPLPGTKGHETPYRIITQIVISDPSIDSSDEGWRMRYVQLRAFHHVAICGGFSRAAEALSLSQPAVSDQVRKLEEEYDVLLFNRGEAPGRADERRAAAARHHPAPVRGRAAGRRAAGRDAGAPLGPAARHRRQRAPPAARARQSSAGSIRASRSSSPRAIRRRSPRPCTPTTPSSACWARSRGRTSSRSCRSAPRR